jgi:hypothetical protein
MFKQTTVSRAVLEANRVFKAAQPETTEYTRVQQAFQANRERLKSERLARETAGDFARKRRAPPDIE